LAGEERVVARPDVYVQLGLRAVGLHDDLAVADDLRLDHLRVDALLHLRRSLSRPASARGASSVLSGGPRGGLERRPRGAARRMLAHAGATSRSAGGRGAGGRAGPGPAWSGRLANGPAQAWTFSRTCRFTRVTMAPMPRRRRGEISSARPIC